MLTHDSRVKRHFTGFEKWWWMLSQLTFSKWWLFQFSNQTHSRVFEIINIRYDFHLLGSMSLSTCKIPFRRNDISRDDMKMPFSTTLSLNVFQRIFPFYFHVGFPPQSKVLWVCDKPKKMLSQYSESTSKREYLSSNGSTLISYVCVVVISYYQICAPSETAKNYR